MAQVKRKRSSEIFAVVDPGLNVVNGGRRRRAKRKDAWKASGGAICPRCGQEAVRFRPEDGVCRQCGDFLNDKKFQDDKNRAKFLRQVKSHNARIEKKKGRA